MADSKVSALTAKTTLTGAEEVYINDAGTSKKATVTNLVAGSGALEFIIGMSLSDYQLDNSVEYSGFFSKHSLNSASIIGSLVMPMDVTLKNFIVVVDAYSGQTNTVNPVVLIGGVATALQTTEVLNTIGTYEVIADVDVDKGEQLVVKSDNTGNTGLYRIRSYSCRVVKR